MSSNFFPSAEYISMLQILPDTASHTIVTTTPYFVIFPGLYVLIFRQSRHGIMASSSDSSCFGLYTDLNFCAKYSYTGQILNSRPESDVVWLLYFHVCFPVFPPFVYSCCMMDRISHSHKFCHSTLAPLCHHFSGTLTYIFSSTCLPLLGHMECPC